MGAEAPRASAWSAASIWTWWRRPTGSPAGESIVGHRVALSPGGKAGNQAAQAALNGARTFLVGRVGRDVFGDRLRAALASTGVDTTYVTVDTQEATGISPVFTGADGEYASIIVPGAGQRLQPEDIEAASEAFAQSALLLLQCEIPIEISAHAARLAQSLGCRVMFNASPAPADAAAIPDSLWSAVDVLLVNGAEAERLSGMSVADVPAAVMVAEALRRRFGMPTVIVTLGGLGAVALDERGTRHLPPGRCRSSRPSGRGMPSPESWPASWPAVASSTRPSRWPMPPGAGRDPPRRPRRLADGRANPCLSHGASGGDGKTAKTASQS